MSTIEQAPPALSAPTADGVPDVASAPSGSSRNVLHVLRKVLMGIVNILWPVVFVYVVWALWIDLKHLPPAVAPHPSDVIRYIFDNPGSYATDALNTLKIVVGGVLVGAIAGIVLATLSWFSSFARAATSAPTLITQCLPIATLVPVIARVFGYNERTVVIVAALIAFFPVLVFTSAGMRSTPAGTTDLFKVFGATRRRRFALLAVPSAIPRLLVALQLVVVVAVVGAMLAQWIMGTNGLGYRLAVAQASFRTSEAWGASVVAILVGVLLYSIASTLSRYAQRRFD
ncbi:ABC transporter permease subunit [soil metagenome]